MIASRLVPEACRVLEAVPATGKEMHFVLEAPQQEPFRPEPGQFVMVSLPGIGEAPISIAAIPGEGTPEDTFELLIRRAGRLTNLVTRLKEGDYLYVRGPYGRRVGWEAFKGTNLVLIAGGLGLAPLRPFVRRALIRRQDFRRIDIAVGARSPTSSSSATTSPRGRRGADDVHVGVTVDAASNGCSGRIGVVTTLFEVMHTDTEDACFICGPPVMYRHAIRKLLAMGFYREPRLAHPRAPDEVRHRDLRTLPMNRPLHARARAALSATARCGTWEEAV